MIIFLVGVILGASSAALIVIYYLENRLKNVNKYVDYAEIKKGNNDWMSWLKSKNNNTLWFTHGHNRKRDAI